MIGLVILACLVIIPLTVLICNKYHERRHEALRAEYQAKYQAAIDRLNQ